MNGLKDHQIAALTNAVRDELQALPGHVGLVLSHYGPLRDLLSRAIVGYLEREGLRIDRKDGE